MQCAASAPALRKVIAAVALVVLAVSVAVGAVAVAFRSVCVVVAVTLRLGRGV